MEQKIKKAVFALFLALLVLPMLQFKFDLIKIKPLSGFYVYAERPTFSWDTWVSMNYQQKYEKYINDFIGFRQIFLRSYNQVWYSLFREVHT